MTFDAAHRDEEGRGGEGGSSGGGSRRKPPKEVSLTNPQATMGRRTGIDPFFAMQNYLIDNKGGIIRRRRRHAGTAEIAITESTIELVRPLVSETRWPLAQLLPA